MRRTIRVLIVDDSFLVRNILTKGLSADPGIEVVGSASDPYAARDQIVALNPDVLTLDVEMPRMDGLTFLKRLMPQFPLPVIMVSGQSKSGQRIALESLEAGAVDFVSKPDTNSASALTDMLMELRTKVKLASATNVSHWKNKKTESAKEARPGALVGSGEASTSKIIAIGASTGGTEAIRKVVTRFAANMPGTVIVQHMPAGFTRMFADRLNTLSAMEVKEAVSGDRVMQGRVLIAPGGYHMSVEGYAGHYKVICKQGEKVSGHRPSVDVLMHSLAECAGADVVGVMLTGMGRDGAAGMLEMRKAGARTLAQNEASSVVFGMPKEAHQNGGAEKLCPIDDIAQAIVALLSAESSNASERAA